MKSNLTKVSVALLSAVFILACQDLAPVGPDGLEPQFDKRNSGNCAEPVKGHCHGDDGGGDVLTFTATFGGGIAANVDLVGPNGGKKNIQNVVGELGSLDLMSLPDLIVGGGTCFVGGIFATQLQINNDQGSEEANISFYFTARNRDGDPGFKYLLVLYDGVIGGEGEWPAVGGESTIDGTSGSFSMHHNNGPGRKTMCLGEGLLSFNATVSTP